MKDEIEKILEKMMEGQEEMTQDNFFDIKTKLLSQATQAILAEVKKCVPPMKNPNILPQQRLSTPEELIYNQTIADLLARMGEMGNEARCEQCGHVLQKEGCIYCKETYYSECCHATMPDYPDRDFCPKCGEHASGYTQEDIEREEGDAGRLLK